MIYECVAHTAAIIRGMFLGTQAETVARNANTGRDQALVRAAAQNMVRFKLAKFDGIYDTYA
jgi:hypothetical protein